MRVRQYIELAVNGCDCRECLEAIIRTAEEENAAELATLRAKNDRIKDAWIVEQKLAVKYHEERQALRAENERMRDALDAISKSNDARFTWPRKIAKEALK